MTTNNPSRGYSLSVVVGTLNRLALLKKCIDSVTSQTTTPVRIYVTDAGSTDGTIEYLKSIASDSISATYLGRKVGQAKAYNEIFKQVATPYVCWLSDDNEIINHSLDTAVKILEENPKIGMVGLKVKDVQGPFAPEPYIGGISTIGILNVNQGVLRTETLQQLGGFSEEFMDYGIDPDLTARVLFAGHDIVYTKDVAIQHRRDWGESHALQAQLAKQERYKKLYLEKYSRDGVQWNLSRFGLGFVGRMKRALARSSWLLSSAMTSHFARDLYNIVLGRYISLFDPIRCIGKRFHLLQRCDRKTIEYYAGRMRKEET